jgi:branched-chain amino acid transport system permease protein
MTSTGSVERWTRPAQITVVVGAVVLAILALGPILFSAGAVDRLTALFIYVILAAMWNALAGYGGLVSVGQQVFFGLGAYFAIRLADAGLDPFVSLVVGAVVVAIISWPVSMFMLRLKGGEFAIGMWVIAALAHLLVNLDTLVRGETGTSLISLNAYTAVARRDGIYWLALLAMIVLLGVLYALLSSRTGAGIQAIRDNEAAASSLGVRIMRTKRILFVLAAFGAAMGGTLWLATATSFQPKAYFSVQWTAYMIFMVLVGGLGTFEGAILGAILFFLIETWFGASGVWYLIGLGATALVFALFLPRGLWGIVDDRFQLRLLPVGYRLRDLVSGSAGRSAPPSAEQTAGPH